MADADAPVAVFKKRTIKNTMRKPAAVAARAPSPSSSSGGSDSENEEGRIVKRRKTAGATVSASTADQKPKTAFEGATTFAGDRSATIEVTNDATRHSNWYEENATDSLSAKSLLGTTRSTTSTKPQSFIQKNPDAPSRQVGPIKAPTNIRTITVTDYAPDVCKDYKQTGFCGFGDNCKFLHAREDYAQGWQLDREWEVSGKGKKGPTTVASANRGAKTAEEEADAADDAMLEKIPFACIICKQPYKNPIVTKCGHYFCEACALQRYRKNPSCAACGADTRGVFNGAKMLKKLLERKKERARKKKEKAREAGEEVSDDENGDAGSSA